MCLTAGRRGGKLTEGGAWKVTGDLQQDGLGKYPGDPRDKGKRARLDPTSQEGHHRYHVVELFPTKCKQEDLSLSPPLPAIATDLCSGIKTNEGVDGV